MHKLGDLAAKRPDSRVKRVIVTRESVAGRKATTSQSTLRVRVEYIRAQVGVCLSYCLLLHATITIRRTIVNESLYHDLV